eukprot:CAMPEP_0194557614 /NCGR_PEP_ID=MMETSP0253-20130528/99333_1 /TAXON_ID=2966 /ORGANISM="Noctiluca scintillans" /LENGTH=138 /DNA_ID=CAMNT_0039405121 /DNA_START=657 /DNA_END=1073 /DNA_ORIENTATION=+
MATPQSALVFWLFLCAAQAKELRTAPEHAPEFRGLMLSETRTSIASNVGLLFLNHSPEGDLGQMQICMLRSIASLRLWGVDKDDRETKNEARFAVYAAMHSSTNHAHDTIRTFPCHDFGDNALPPVSCKNTWYSETAP